MFQRVTIIGLQCIDLLHLSNPIGLVPKLLHIGMTSRVRVLNGTTEIRASIPPEFSFAAKCYKYQGYEYLAASWPSLVKIIIIDGAPTEATESDSDEYTYHPDVKTDDESSSNDVGLNCIRPTPSTHLSVVKCVPSPPAEKDDWRRTVTFHTFTKIGDNSCKVIVDSKSCTNAISSRLCENLRLEIIPPLHPFKVS